MAASRTDRPRTPRWQRATAIVPLALLAGAWTASIGGPTTATADSAVTDPGVPSVPTTSLDQPANYTDPSQVDSGDLSSGANQPPLDPTDPSSVSANGIPSAAMLAYQRAEAVLAEADPSCHISWTLIAAIGRVESDHGRYGGNVLGADGRSRPGIYGLRLDGSHGTALITDTDGGAYDNDPVYDRAVGPLQFIPGTWDIVGVDGDGDGARDPQDIDDAALATAVYLCAGDGDLSTTAGQRSAVFSYNHSEQYVDLVLAIMDAYLHGDYTTVPDGLPIASYLAAKQSPSDDQTKSRDHNPGGDQRSDVDAPTSQPGDNTSTAPSTGQTATSTTNPAGGGGDPTTTTTTSAPTTSVPTLPDPTSIISSPPPVVEDVLTLAEATTRCSDTLKPLGGTSTMITECAKVLEGKTSKEADKLLSGDTLLEVLQNLGLASLCTLPLICS